ncbi:lysozyme [Ancylobacter amanitiformis]|uniref:Lysozyme n=1 Tax=Ancylobacter amanitiformis TaxID=217069 RepID=A0ABU0LMB9_9HYPH|nr:lysozyme [Ancylobacter amanitiformis]MDQ0509758.1 GH24 family phage-related lysozyme (muramidase) [Ancylobacter amanitiformis]
MPRSINAAGLALIQQWEGKRLVAYKDPVGIWTIGYGHTDAAGAPKVTPGLTITDAEAIAILRRDLGQYEAAVRQAVTVALTDNQFAALVSFCFNVGPANFRKSTLLKKLNAGDPASVPRELMKWNKAGGKVLPGLTNRRAAEAGLWAKGEFVASNYVEPAPKPRATGSTEGKGTATASVGVLGTAASDAAQQLAPLTEVSSVLKYAFVALTVIGIAVAVYGVWKRSRSDVGLA